MIDILGFFSKISVFLRNNEWLVTTGVGLIAYFIYKKTKDDFKRSVAQLILQEIRYAEQQIRIAREHNHVYSLARMLLPTNSWSENIHLFVNDLEETDIDFISGFYSKTMYIDGLIEFISNYKCSPQQMDQNKMPQIVHQNNQVMQQTINEPTGGLPNNQPQNQLKINIMVPALPAEQILKDVSQNIEFIYNTPTIDKLRCIAKKRWYTPFKI